MSETEPLPTPPESLLKMLETMGIPYVLHHHEAVFTCEQSAPLKAVIPGVHIKNLFLKDKKDRMALVVVPDELGLDLKALAPAIGLDRISFGSAERLWTHLGVRPGSVNPFCVINDKDAKVQIILDKRAAEAEQVSGHPMLNTMSVTVSGKDLVKFLESTGHTPKIMDLGAYTRAEAA